MHAAAWHSQHEHGAKCCKVLFAGFVVPNAQFSNYGSVNHLGVTQAAWNACFHCGNTLNQCTAVAGSPTLSDQFSLYRGAL